MKLTLLGTGGYHPNERRHTACLMLPEIGLLFDAGSSFFRVPPRLQTDEIQIVLSHAHLDHICGLTFLLPTLLNGTIKSARVYADAKTLSAVQTHLFAEEIFPVHPAFEYVELPQKLDVGQGGSLTHFPLVHPGGSTGFRVDWPHRSLAYITDTNCDGSCADFLRGVDVLVHECNFRDGEEEIARLTGHSTLSPVAQLARDAGVGRLLLNHLDPTLTGDDPLGIETARAIFPNVEVTKDLQDIEF